LRVGARLARQLAAPQQQLLTPITAGNSNTYLEYNFNFNLHNKVVGVFVDLNINVMHQILFFLLPKTYHQNVNIYLNFEYLLFFP
jgi:hypothetical protein